MMTTDLFLATGGLDASMLARVAPPSCWRGVDGAGVCRRDGADTLLELGTWTPRRPAAHLLPSLAPLAAAPAAFRFELSVRAAGEWSPWVATLTVGDAEIAPLPAAAGPLTVDVDELRASPPAEAIRLRVRCRGALATPWLAALSAAGVGGVDSEAPAAPGVRLPVPSLSQMTEDPAIALRICSPTSVAMVLGYWGRPTPAAVVAADVFHRATDRYGVWPAAIRAAAARGVAGYLIRFPDWSAAAWCLARGIPIIASIRYAAGELTGAAVEETTGHLVVLTGYENGVVLVNDPAAPTGDTVPRRYRRDELTRAWLERAGVGYVLFDPARVEAATLSTGA
jgi:hypothetical protein